jgi:hypothetical protein
MKSPEEFVAMKFHQTYERLAPNFGYKTREASAVEWEEVPETNKKLMIAVVKKLLETGVISTEQKGYSE